MAGLVHWLAPVGALVLAGVVIHTLAGWVKTLGAGRIINDGAAVALFGAGLGLLMVIAAGLVHGLGGMPGRPAVTGFFALFLLPLVTGALSQLLPVWRFPGPATPPRALLRARLVCFGALRTALFLAGGGLLTAGVAAGALLLAAGVLLFAAVLMTGLVGTRSPH
ncbi:MAG: hypothetical protein E6Q92_09950 [Burkholderiaceae bacterium]|nr:MAG: hypothetical protein E6Q92_09950 [Burkholderiaceae bacterium]